MCQFSHAGTHTLARKEARTFARTHATSGRNYLAPSSMSHCAISRLRFFTREFCTHTRLRAANTPSLASLTSRAEGAGRGRGRMFHLSTAWAVFRGANLKFLKFFLCELTEEKAFVVNYWGPRKLSFEPFSDTKTFFRTFLWHENFLSNLSLTRKLSFKPFCMLEFSQPIRS